MHSVDEALALVIERCEPGSALEVSVEDALGLALAEDVRSQLDVPPYDKALMDGYALSHNTWSPNRKLKVIGRITAGNVFEHPLQDGSAVQIMTGAPIPAGADCVSMFEQTNEFDPDDRPWVKATGQELPATITIDLPPKILQHIMPRGMVMKSGDVILARGHVMRAIDVALAVESGNDRVRVYPKPSVAVLATGDELIEAGSALSPGQIYNSNSPMIAALSRQLVGAVMNLGIARDQTSQLEDTIARGLQSDVLILTGGVSAGVLDLVPAALDAQGIKQVFHKVRLKPGKPVWFGTKYRSDGRQILVFGLPGNPVSSFVCYCLFVIPVIRKLAGQIDSSWRELPTATLLTAHEHKGNRPTYWPAIQTCSDAGRRIEILAWQGSADLSTLAKANSLAIFPAGDRIFQVGEPVDFIALPE